MDSGRQSDCRRNVGGGGRYFQTSFKGSKQRTAPRRRSTWRRSSATRPRDSGRNSVDHITMHKNSVLKSLDEKKAADKPNHDAQPSRKETGTKRPLMVLTIGHSMRTIGEFIQLLQAHGATNGNADCFIQTLIRRRSGGEKFFESRKMRITHHSGHAIFGSR